MRLRRSCVWGYKASVQKESREGGAGEQRMAEISDLKSSESPEEVTFWGLKLAEKDPGLLRTRRVRVFPGCLARVPPSLPLLLASLVFFVLLVTTLVQVSRIHHQSFRAGSWDCQKDRSSAAVSPEQIHSGLEEIRQQLDWMNKTLVGLCRPCPWNWEFFQGSCYFFSWTKGIWKASESACERLGTQLVIINNAEEQEFLKFWTIRRNTRIWIGLSDHHVEDSWHWVDNSSVQLSFWMEGEPNNHENEDCVELTNDGWNDNKCTVENFWICEKRSNPCPGF
ncbi:CD209 antigen-like protein C [Dasypus novemcinctus]|uniref:CD209 antigen-like protein C n=1 Tax=Dasypus novemcinctus TaxID=9361 RepID=UPI0003CBEA9D|nr:CD209 antigen-like protein C [Dasypus novemcinctus]